VSTGPLPRVVVCGLGPASADLLTTGARAAVDRIEHRYLRTRRHPSAEAVEPAESFDVLYEKAEAIDDVYDGIVEALVAAASTHGEVLYAVPGSPTVAESSVERLRRDGRAEVTVLPAVSFLDLAWDRLGVDPLDAGVRLVDGHRFEAEAAGERGPLLVAQCDTRQVLSDVKLVLGEIADGAEPDASIAVMVLQRLGLPDEAVTTVRWDELDRVVEPDHLTSLYVPELAAPLAGEVVQFADVVRTLRRECPWDREQTHESLRRHLLEESYEVLEAIDHLDVEAGEGYDELEEELGDLWLQVLFHATLAAEQGRFELADVARRIRQKLVGRHPHVFGDVVAETAADVASNWHQIKKAEKQRLSVMDGIPRALPALLYTAKVQKRAKAEGVDWRGLLDAEAAGTVGGRLLELVDEALAAGLDPETELRVAAERVRDRFAAQEAAAAEAGEGAASDQLS
jgi:tetrapyrrole methylase family protein / MazG family protein